jgi:hypothetical protein
MPLNLTYGLFQERLNEMFRISAGAGSIDLQLTECSLINSPSGESQGREPFSLVFCGPMSPALVQRIHTLENQHLGKLEIFLVPIGPDKTGMRYEAVFN